MALNQTNILVWIVETIYKARKITFEDLNRKWIDNVDLSGGEEMLKRCFDPKIHRVSLRKILTCICYVKTTQIFKIQDRCSA